LTDKNASIIITGAAGFIGSCLVGYLNSNGYTNLILVDDYCRADKIPNLVNKQFTVKIEREELFKWLAEEKPIVDFVFHIGARTDTTEFNYAVHQHLNVAYSQLIWNYCTTGNIPLVYASSAATYGSGEAGYNDDHETIQFLQPLNAYGISKNEFDKWVLQQQQAPPFWAGLKFFNVYGPNEYHKGRMASVIFHSFNQIKASGKVKLFKSHHPEYRDGEQLRDFIYVKDILTLCLWMLQNRTASGIYNLGTGTARSFNDLVKATYAGLNLPPEIEYIDMPEDIRDKYQYFTEANMHKLRNAGYKHEFTSLEKGIDDYVRNFLLPARYY
jgi:ADP-L-glycero-D-manno-heptose 6-epimerase